MERDAMTGQSETLTDMGSIYAKLGTGALPVQPMIDPAYFERERSAVFGRSWLMVGRAEEIPNPGDVKVKQLVVLNTSALLVRGRDGTIRAFHNLCTHRGNKVVPETGGNETFARARGHSLTCRFHGWVFDTSGDLKSVPQKERFPESLDTACLGLRPMHCEVWDGFIFINVADTPDQSLTDFLGGMAGHFGGYPWHEASFSRRYTAVLNCNWKIALYAFSEGYHVETIHAATLPGIMTFEQNEYKVFGPHSTSALFVPGAGTMKDLPSGNYLAGLLKSHAVHGPRLGDLPAAINSSRRNDFQFEFPVFFPNLVLHLGANNGYPGMSHFYHQFWPLDHKTTLWEGINFYRQPERPYELVAITNTDAIHRNAWLEDTSTMEETDAALRSAVLDEIVLMDDEVMIRNTAHHIDALVAQA